MELEQVMQALRNAHAVGDTAAAQRLAGMAQRLRESGTPPPEPVAQAASGVPDGYELVGTFADNGRVLRGPDGALNAVSAGGSTTDAEAIGRIMNGEGFAEITHDSFQQQAIADQPGIARLNEFTRGAPFVGEYIDEAVGVFSPDARDAMRYMTDAMREQRPGETMGLNLAGGLAYSAPLIAAGGPALLDKAQNMGRIPRGIAGGLLGGIGGATEGAVSGYGAGETPEDRMDNAQTYATWGGLLGGAGGAAGPWIADGVGGLAQKAGDYYRGVGTSRVARDIGVSPSAADVLRRTFEGTDAGAASQVIARAGDNAMLGEVSPASRGLLDALAVRPGQARNVVNQAVDGRATATNAQMRGVLDDVLGDAPLGVRTVAEETARRTGPARSAAYDLAYSTPIDYTGTAGRQIEDVFQRTPPAALRSAISAANEEIMSNPALRNAGVSQILADIAEDGTVSFRELPNVAQIDQLKRGLQEVAYRNTDTFGRLDATGTRYNRLAGELRDATVDATGGAQSPYAAALATGGDKIAQDQALDVGSRMLSERVTREDVARMMTNANDEVREAARIGIRQQADEIMARTRRVASDPNVDARQVNSILGPLSAETTRTKIGLVLGEEEAARLFREVDQVQAAFGLRAAVSENSRTVSRQLANEALDTATAPNVFQQFLAAEPVDAVKSTVQILTGEGPVSRALRTDAVAEELARYLTQQRGRTAEAAVQYLSNVSRGQNLSEAQARLVANALTTTGYFAGVPAGTRAIAAD